MPLKRPVIVIDDDNDDLEMIEDAFKSLETDYQMICFNEALKALDYLKRENSNPLFILCDIRMPVISGPDLRLMINEVENLRKKNIPFVFYSTSADPGRSLKENVFYIQGFFKKPESFEGIQQMLRCIIIYWSNCIPPGDL